MAPGIILQSLRHSGESDRLPQHCPSATEMFVLMRTRVGDAFRLHINKEKLRMHGMACHRSVGGPVDWGSGLRALYNDKSYLIINPCQTTKL